MRWSLQSCLLLLFLHSTLVKSCNETLDFMFENRWVNLTKRNSLACTISQTCFAVTLGLSLQGCWLVLHSEVTSSRQERAAGVKRAAGNLRICLHVCTRPSAIMTGWHLCVSAWNQSWSCACAILHSLFILKRVFPSLYLNQTGCFTARKVLPPLRIVVSSASTRISAMFEQKIKFLNINLNALNERCTFSSGDLLTGNISFELSKETTVTSITMAVKGKAHVHWSSGSGRNRRNYTANLDFFKLQGVIVRGNSGRKSVTQSGHGQSLLSRVTQCVFLLQLLVGRSFKLARMCIPSHVSSRRGMCAWTAHCGKPCWPELHTTLTHIYIHTYWYWALCT